MTRLLDTGPACTQP